jgi:hypothetical protein
MNKRAVAWTMAAVLLLVAIALQFGPHKAPAGHILESAMFEKMQTWCFGRYLMDVPKEARLRGSGIEYLGRSIESERMTRDEFKAKVSESINDFKEESYRVGRCGFDREIEVGDEGVIIIGKKVVYQDDISYKFNTYKFSHGWVFRTFGGAYAAEKLDFLIEKFSTYLRTVRHRSEWEIPQEPGVCFQNGFIANGENMGLTERAVLTFELKDYPDIMIRIKSEVNLTNVPPLLSERRKAARLDERYPGRIKRIRAVQREINGMAGEEFFDQILADDKSGYAHEFIWETVGVLNDPDKPRIQFKVTSGEGVTGVMLSSSLETKSIQALYEAIVKSIRLRPVEDPKPEPQAQAPDPEDFPHRIATGDACPKRGHWRCVEDGHRYNFVVGQRMPNATFSQPATGFFNRLMGKLLYRDGPGHWEWAEETPPAETRE